MREGGFSLVELLVILAVIAILAGIVSISSGGILEVSNERAASAERAVVANAISSYNTLDVVEGAPEISALGAATPVRIGIDGSYGFDAYLDSETRYFYWWADEGESLQVFYTPDEAVPVCLGLTNSTYVAILQDDILSNPSTIADSYQRHVALDSDFGEPEDLYWSVQLE